MRVTTMENLAGRSIVDTLGAVRGSVYWTRGLKKFNRGGIRAVEYMTMNDVSEGLNKAREDAEAMMKKQALALGADAIIGVKMEVVEMGNNMFAANCYGTAVMTEAANQQAAAPVFGKAAPVATVPFGAIANDANAAILPFPSLRKTADGSGVWH